MNLIKNEANYFNQRTTDLKIVSAVSRAMIEKVVDRLAIYTGHLAAGGVAQ